MAMIKCPECGKEVSDKANACPNCGCPIASEKPAKVKYCPRCNKENPEGTQFCNHCGKDFTENEKIKYKMCKQCGADMPETDNICKKCNCNQEAYNPFQATTDAKEGKVKEEKKKDSVLSVIACVFAFVSVFAFNFLGIVGLIIALIDLLLNDKTKKHTGSFFAILIGIIVFLVVFWIRIS